MLHILTPPISPLVSGKQIVIALVHRDHRVGSGAVFSCYGKIRDWGIAVIDIDWVAVSKLLLLRDGMIKYKQQKAGNK